MDGDFGLRLDSHDEVLRRAWERFRTIRPDRDLWEEPAEPYPDRQTTLASPTMAEGPGTFSGRHVRRIALEPYAGEGWWMDRTDLDDSLPTRVSVRNVWTTGAIVSNIVLRSGAPHNYVRMVEHIIALKLGLGLDNVLIRLESGDPPLFERGSLDWVEAVERAGIVETAAPARFFAVKERVSICSGSGAFLILSPPPPEAPRRLRLDVAIDFPNVIGRQRVRFVVNRRLFREVCVARTNTSFSKRLYCHTVGRLFADIRHLGYTRHNIVIAGRRRYVNEPRLVHEGKSLEVVWHRAALDLLAALSLVEEGRLVGDVISFKAGHALDVRLITKLYRRGLLEELR